MIHWTLAAVNCGQMLSIQTVSGPQVIQEEKTTVKTIKKFHHAKFEQK